MNVAVKVLKRDGLTPAIRRQFVEEANTMAQLADHPYIVQVFRSEQTPDGGAYLVMKYYPPPNLAVRAKRERFGVEEVLRNVLAELDLTLALTGCRTPAEVTRERLAPPPGS